MTMPDPDPGGDGCIGDVGGNPRVMTVTTEGRTAATRAGTDKTLETAASGSTSAARESTGRAVEWAITAHARRATPRYVSRRSIEKLRESVMGTPDLSTTR